MNASIDLGDTQGLLQKLKIILPMDFSNCKDKIWFWDSPCAHTATRNHLLSQGSNYIVWQWKSPGGWPLDHFAWLFGAFASRPMTSNIAALWVYFPSFQGSWSYDEILHPFCSGWQIQFIVILLHAIIQFDHHLLKMLSSFQFFFLIFNLSEFRHP